MPVYAPVVQWHGSHGLNALSHEDYYALNMPFLRKAYAMHILCELDFSQSKGVEEEIQLAQRAGVPIYTIGITDRGYLVANYKTA